MNDLYGHLPHLYVFLTVVEQGSFQAAARRLALPRSSVSKRVAQLETQLGLRLLQRSTRRLHLTAEGQALLEAAQPLIAAMQQVANVTQQAALVLRGKVVISSSTLIGERYLLPLLVGLKCEYPGIVIELRLTDLVVDLIADGADLALRIGNLPDSSMVAKRVGTKRWGCFASPDYLARQGIPQTPAELAQHECLLFRSRSQVLDHWVFAASGEEVSLKITEAHSADDGRTLVAMACSGLGIIWGDPNWVRAELEQGRLVEVLESWRPGVSSPIHWLSLGKSARNPAVEVVWQHLGERLLTALS
ncbi:LysR family transcriptional regulator [Oceanobacter antarcticus]|uniref:LysR family transcriptional regulator n=1 Tax=Oceanobacter antarcticus TaxID=3133425 RepID=A0ABW8NHN4_9GAMM